MIKPRTYWLTGASSGIGKALALQLAAAGHCVYITARNELALNDLAAQYPQQLIPLAADVSDDSAMQNIFLQLPVSLRPAYLDGLILCAGSCEYVDLPELDLSSFRRVADVNYFGVVNACAAALPLLEVAAKDKSRSKPEITGVCSMTVMTGFPRAQAYGSAKAAMRYFLESLRCDVQKSIDVCVVYPGFVLTPMTEKNDFPMPFSLSAETAAANIMRNLHKGKRSVWFPWQLRCQLRFVQWFQGLWFAVLVPKLSRQVVAAKGTLAESSKGRRS